MLTEEQISSLVLRVQEARERGETCRVEDVCAKAPELIGEVERRLALLAAFEPRKHASDSCTTQPLSSPHLAGDTASYTPASGGSSLPYPKGELSFLEPPLLAEELGRLGRFRILEVLGIGGMGMVFRAHDTELHRDVALKVMRPEFRDHPTARPRFLQEARAMAAIKDDHVITVHDVGILNNVPFLTMELLLGQGLHHRLEQRRRLPWSDVVQIGIEAARGLAAAHERGLIHRDIKPSNLWLEQRPGAGPKERGERVKVLDFGLARATAGDRSLSPEGSIMGTPAYMAPEQTHGQPLDVRADLFSLGAVLYELATGQQPFGGQDVMEILLKINNEQQAPARKLTPDMPIALSDLIDDLLAKDRERRPGNAREVIRRLQGIQEDVTESLPNVGKRAPANPSIEESVAVRETLPVPTTASNRKRWGLAIAGGITSLLIGLTVWGLACGWFRSPVVSEPREKAVVEEKPLHGDLIVHVRKQDGTRRKGRFGTDVGADLLMLPVRENDQLQLEAKLDQVAYVYLLWVDGKGEVTPLYPWNPDGKLVYKTLAAPPAQTPKREVLNPQQLDNWWPADDTEGLDTMLMLARRTPLPADVSWADLVGKLPEAKLGPPHELVVRGMDSGKQVEEVKQRDQNRRPKADADVIEDQLLNLMGRLKDHFELIRAVQFAHAKK